SGVDYVRQRKHGEHRHHICEPFVESSLVGRRTLHISPAQAIKQRMGGFVRHDVMGEAGEDGLAGASHEISKKNGTIIPGIKRMCVSKCMWDKVHLMSIETPSAAASKRKLKLCQRAHSDRVYILSVKTRILQKLLIVKPARP